MVVPNMVRGYVSAFDVDTGKLAWRFYTVPGDPSLPFEHSEMELAGFETGKAVNGGKLEAGAPFGIQ